MGEPLNNYTALVEAIRVMTGPPFHLSPKRITISTVMRSPQTLKKNILILIFYEAHFAKFQPLFPN